METSEYLHKKYGFTGNTKIPTEFLGEELLLPAAKAGRIAAQARGQKCIPQMLRFDEFCKIVESELDG